jgi:tetratricopeptide (TPR) repeat protein
LVKSLQISFIMVLLCSGLSQAVSTAVAPRDYAAANRLFASGRFQDALSLYQQLLDSPPPNIQKSDILTRIGDSWFRLGSFQNALEAYRSALPGQQPSVRPETQYWIGFCCFLLGRDADAVMEFLKIPELYPRSGMWVGTAYYWAGRASERMGKKEEAASYYRKAGGSGSSTQAQFARKKAEAVKGSATAPKKSRSTTETPR